MNNCEFCNNQIDEKQMIFKGKFIKILYPQKPIIKHHFLLMPIEHKKSLDDLNEEESIELIKLVKMIKQKLQVDSNYAGYNIVSNSGAKAGQKINHAHIHIFVRFHKEKISPFVVLSNPQRNRGLKPSPDIYRKYIKEFTVLFS